MKSESVKYQDIFKIPNLITFGRMCLSFCILFLFLFDYNTFLIKWLFVIGIISDKLDGVLARLLNQKTRLGLILEQMADTFLVFFTILFVTFRMDFPIYLFIAYVIIIMIGLVALFGVYFIRDKMFARKLIVSEMCIFFIYGAGFFYLFDLPGRLYLAYIALILGLVSLVDFLVRLYRFAKEDNKNIKENKQINEAAAQENQ